MNRTYSASTGEQFYTGGGVHVFHNLGASRYTDAELVTLVWQLVIAGQTPTNLIVNGLEALLTHPASDRWLFEACRIRLAFAEKLRRKTVSEPSRGSGPRLLWSLLIAILVINAMYAALAWVVVPLS